MVLLDDFNTVQQIINESPEFAAVLKKRGITDPKKVITTPLTVGFFDGKDGLKQEDRLLKVISYLDVGDGNYWAHPIENWLRWWISSRRKSRRLRKARSCRCRSRRALMMAVTALKR